MMVERERLKEIFSWVQEDERILAVLLFGSVVKGEDHARSDLDVAIVVPGASPYYYECEGVTDDRLEARGVLMKSFREVNTGAVGIDIHIFEELPLHIQMDIIEEHEVIYTSDKYGMHEYFYNYRKIWADQKHRNTMTKEELLAGL